MKIPVSVCGMSANEIRGHLGRHNRLVMFIGCLGSLAAASIASAAEGAVSPVPTMKFPVAQIFTFLFLMLGPFKIIGPFAKITKGKDARFTQQIAVRATFFASIALLLAAVLGERILSSYGIPLPVLALAAGIILFLVALKHILEELTGSASDGEETSGPGPTPTLKMALTPLAFPTIVTPYGIAALVVFLAYSPDFETRLIIGGVTLAIMLLNLIVMVATRYILPILGAVMPILAAVLGVVQVALGLQIINNSLRALRIL
jgi:multiple antibiotic resistance protein